MPMLIWWLYVLPIVLALPIVIVDQLDRAADEPKPGA